MFRAMLVGICVVAAAASGPPIVQEDRSGPPDESAGQLVAVRLVADVPHIRPGRTFNLAVVFRIEKHWHIYWKNPGAGGLPTEVIVSAPDGFTVGPVRFPRPRRFGEGREISYGYEEETVLFVPITAPKTLDAESASFDCQISWLVCRKACVLGSDDQSITLPVSAASRETPEKQRDSLLAKHLKRLPRPMKDLKASRVAIENEQLVITGPLGGLDRIAFFPGYRPGVTFGEARIKAGDDRFSIHVPLTVAPTDSLGEPMAAEGLVALGDRDDDPCYEFSLSLGEAPSSTQSGAD